MIQKIVISSHINLKQYIMGLKWLLGRIYIICIFGIFSMHVFANHEHSKKIGDPLEITVTNTTHPCANQNNGSISISIAGGIAPIAISWSNGANDVTTINNLGPGTYTVTVSDNQPSSTSAMITLTAQNAINITPTTVQTITCANPNATVAVSATGGAGGFSFLWSNGASGSSITVNTPGAYVVTVTDNNSCTNSLSVNVTSNTAVPTISAGSNTSLSCAGQNIMLNGSGPTGGSFTIQWTTSSGNIVSGANTYTPTVNAAGTYTLTVTNNNNGCQSTAQVTVSPAANQLSVSINSTNITCAGLTNGTMTAVPTGGGGGNSFLWSNGGNSATINNLATGAYTVTVSDAAGCTATATASITAPSPITVSVNTTNQTQVGVNNGTASANASGGTGTLTYLWSNGGTGATINNLAPGIYTVTVTDANGCTNSASGTVNAVVCNLTASININNTISCFGGTNGSLTAVGTNPNGGATFLWNTGATGATINNLGIGTYTVTVTDGAGCTATASQTLTQPTALTVSLNVIQMTGVGANNGSIAASPAGGTPNYTYAWSTGGTGSSINNLAPGTYTVTVTDSRGCTTTASGTIQTINCTLAVTTSITTQISCNGGSNGAINATPSGGSGTVTYLWSNGSTSQNISNLTAGNYSVTVTDALNCTASQSITLSQPSAIQATVTTTNQSQVGVNNGSAQVQATGGTGTLSFLWNTGATTTSINNLAPGNYTVTVTDANGCSTTASGMVQSINCNFSVVISVATVINCFGENTGALQATQTGGSGTIIYNWSNGGTGSIITGLTAGNYQVTVTDAAGCTATASFNLTQPNALTGSTTVTQMTGVNANNGSITTTVSGGSGNYQYVWSNGATSSSISNLSPGTYTVTITDANGCALTLSGTINAINCTLTANIVVVSGINCNGQSTGQITVQTNGGQGNLTYAWSNNATSSTLSGLNAGTYQVTVTDALGCTATASVSLNQPAAIVINLTVVQMTGPNSNNGSISASVTGGTGQIQYIWSNGSTSSMIQNLAPGTYNLTVSDANNCTATATATINTINCTLSANITVSSSISCAGGGNGALQVNIEGGQPPIGILWSTGATSTQIQNLSAGTYGVTVTDGLNCTAVASIQLNAPSALNVQLTTAGLTADASNDGSISATVNGGTPNYTYAWSNGATGSVINNLAPGSYTVTVTDANGCTRTATATINPFVCNINAVITITSPIKCAGGMDGALAVNVTGGAGTITYVWSNGATTASIAGLEAGFYEVTVTDEDNCVAEAEIDVIAPPALIITASVTALSGANTNDGSITLSTTGGTGNISYIWSTGGTTNLLTSLAPGTYSVTITDENECSKDTSFTISPFNCTLTAVVNGTTPVSCFGGNNGSVSIGIDGAQGSFSIVINENPMLNPNGLSAGNYNAVVTDAAGCTATVSFVIAQPIELELQVLEFTGTINQEGTGSIEISISGGTGAYTTSWFYNGMPISPTNPLKLESLNSGEYLIVVVDENGCSKSLEIIINLVNSSNETTLFTNLTHGPNPVNNRLYVHFETVESVGQIHYTVMHVSGKTMSSGQQAQSMGTITIETDSYPSGSYILVLRSPKGLSQSIKFIKT